MAYQIGRKSDSNYGKINIHVCKNAFRYACSNGDIQMVKWLFLLDQ